MGKWSSLVVDRYCAYGNPQLPIFGMSPDLDEPGFGCTHVIFSMNKEKYR
jgi:hypothetical protein